MRTIRLKASALTVTLATLIPLTANATLQQELDTMFGDMTNYTAPGVFESQRRGVISGGSFVSRSRIMQENLIGFVPPSASSSCSGTDLFGGSFSFINSDQLVQLLRSIAANATGYAFQLALSSMCEKCMENIEILQKKIQQFNQYFSNSCQLAKGLVTDTASSVRNQEVTTQAMGAHFRGFGDIFQSWSLSDGTSPEQKLQDVAPDDVTQKIQGNLVWRALKQHNANAWFTNGDDSLLEAIMSITGTIIVGELYENAAAGGWTRDTNTIPPRRDIKMRDIMYGNPEARIYRCNTYDQDGCTQLFDAAGNPELQVVAITGLRERILTTLLGDATNPGVIRKYRYNSGATTAAERSLMAALPDGMGAMIRTLALKSEIAAEWWVNDSIDYITVDMAYTLINAFLQAVESATKINENAHAKELYTLVREARDEVDKEYQTLKIAQGPRKRLIEAYNEFIKATDHRTYTVSRKAPAKN